MKLLILKVSGVQPNHGWRHLWREIVRGTRMKPELCDYMCGHEGERDERSLRKAEGTCPFEGDGAFPTIQGIGLEPAAGPPTSASAGQTNR